MVGGRGSVLESMIMHILGIMEADIGRKAIIYDRFFFSRSKAGRRLGEIEGELIGVC